MGACCCTPKDFVFKTETHEDGETKVMLNQPLKVPFDNFVANKNLMIRILTANGVKDIKSIEIKHHLEGGLSGLNRMVVIHFTGDTPSKKIVIKGHNGGYSTRMYGSMREAWFYERLAPEMQAQGFRCPNTLLNVFDNKSGQQLIFMELIENCSEVYHILKAYNKGEESLKGFNKAINDEVMGEVLDQIADQAAIMHLSHWMDKDLLEKSDTIFPTARWRRGLDKQGFNKNKKDLNTAVWIGNNITTTLHKHHPISAKAANNAAKNFTWELY